MPLFNRTKDCLIEQNVRLASGFFRQSKGLMFESEKRFNYALVFPMAREGRLFSSIHCLFVFFPIDVVYLDKNKKVVDIRKNVRPFSLFDMPKKPAKYIVELRAGKSAEIRTGDQLGWQ